MNGDPRDMMAAYIEGRLDSEQVMALEAYLREDRQHAKALVREAMLDCHLGELLQEQNRQEVAADLSDDSQFDALLQALDAPNGSAELVDLSKMAQRNQPAPAQEEPGSLSAHDLAAVTGYALRLALTSKPAKKLFAYAGVAAAVLLAVLMLNPWGHSDAPTDTPLASDHANDSITPGPDGPALNTPVATLTSTHNARWAQGASTSGSSLYPSQTLTLTAGFAEITTARGAIAILEAPATIELLDNDNALRLHTGKLVGICETESSKGFTVKTDHADITDLGTEFGVEVIGNRVSVSVFTGKVRLDAAGLASQQLTTWGAADLIVEGATIKLSMHESPEAILARFTRRIPRPESTRYARLLGVQGFAATVIPNGFYENAKPYTDRTYVLTGVGGEGLPPELVGGDLIQMPGDARTGITDQGTQMQLELDLAVASDVYLLLSPRERAPAWLNRDYEQTPWRVGVFFNPQRTDSYSVWKLKKPVTGRATVARNVSNSMYSVVVVPRSEETDKQP